MAIQESTNPLPTNVIELPTAAREPVINNRRRGSYGRKVVSFARQKVRRAPVATEPDPAALVEFTEALRELTATGQVRGIAFVVNLDGEDCKAGVVGTLEDDFDLAQIVWKKLEAFMAARASG